VQSQAIPSNPAQGHVEPSSTKFDAEHIGQRSAQVPDELHQPGQETRPVAEGNAQIMASRTHNALRAQPTPTPLPLGTMHFLQPLVGIDLTNVRVHRGILAEQLTTSYRADAITIGNEVAIAAGYADETPETLGLLAHEFTHMARRNDPRFVPPILRSGNIPSATVSHSPATPSRREGKEASPFPTGPLPLEREQPGEYPAQANEETLAQQVEHQVAQIAQEQIEPVPSFNAAGIDPSERQPPTSVPEMAGSWNGLPAPWEPLPHWLTSLPPETVGTGSAQDTGLVQGTGSARGTGSAQGTIPTGLVREGGAYADQTGSNTPLLESVGGGSTQGTGSVQGTTVRSASVPTNSMLEVQRAGEERSPIGEEGRSTPPARQPAVRDPEPDLDVLAQQVHAILKRRMAAEQRRAHR
jgi:hypothetical protein